MEGLNIYEDVILVLLIMFLVGVWVFEELDGMSFEIVVGVDVVFLSVDFYGCFVFDVCVGLDWLCFMFYDGWVVVDMILIVMMVVEYLIWGCFFL